MAPPHSHSGVIAHRREHRHTAPASPITLMGSERGNTKRSRRRHSAPRLHTPQSPITSQPPLGLACIAMRRATNERRGALSSDSRTPGFPEFRSSEVPEIQRSRDPEFQSSGSRTQTPEFPIYKVPSPDCTSSSKISDSRIQKSFRSPFPEPRVHSWGPVRTIQPASPQPGCQPPMPQFSNLKRRVAEEYRA